MDEEVVERRLYPGSSLLLGVAFAPARNEFFAVLRGDPERDDLVLGPPEPGIRRYHAYRYERVFDDVIAGLDAAPSAGRYFIEKIKHGGFFSEDLSPLDWPTDREHIALYEELAPLADLLDALMAARLG